jgi:hypothetical protein
MVKRMSLAFLGRFDHQAILRNNGAIGRDGGDQSCH